MLIYAVYGYPMGIYRSYDLQNVPKSSTAISEQLKLLLLPIGGGGGGANTKVPDMYGVGGVFGTQNTKVTCTLLYNKGGCPYFIPNHKSINGTFVHTFHNKIIKNYEK